jgi:hypothetical protein
MRILALIVSLGFAFTQAAPVPAMADTVKLREDAPDRHVVVKGDTLWDISAKFLKSPWKWPEVWQINKAHIKNPHLIYPGDVVYLIMTPDGPRLSTLSAIKLYPNAHYEPISSEAGAIPTVPYAAVQALLKKPLLATGDALSGTPRLIGSEDGRVMLTLGDRVYADNITADAVTWDIVRLGNMLKDPDTGADIAQEAEVIGRAKTVATGRPATLEILSVEREIATGDRLIPTYGSERLDFTPRAPDRPIDGSIISAYGSSQASGKYTTVIINKGQVDGLAPGHVLAVFREGRTMGLAADQSRFATFPPKAGYIDGAHERALREPKPSDGRERWVYMDYKCLKPEANVASDAFYDPAQATTDCPPTGDDGKKPQKWAYIDIGCLKPGKKAALNEPFFDPREVYDLHCRQKPAENPIKLPDLQSGHIMVYRVFDKVSYGLVMDSPRPIYLLDRVRNP